MKGLLVVCLVALFGLTGCGMFHARAGLYPIQGPLAQQTPRPIYSAVLQAGAHSGTFHAVLGSGENCNGRWTRVSTKQREAGSSAPVMPDLKAAWDAVYGAGYYTSNVLGADMHIDAQVTCDKGSSLDAEAVQNQFGTGQHARLVIKGVAQDNKGNVYKMAF